MLATAAGDITWATIAGTLAMVCLAVSPLFKHRTTVLLAQLGTSAGYGVHYALCGIMTAAVSCGLSAVQVLLAIPLAARPSFKPIFYLFAPVLVVTAMITWRWPPWPSRPWRGCRGVPRLCGFICWERNWPGSRMISPSCPSRRSLAISPLS
jgi:hypothetical protein